MEPQSKFCSNRVFEKVFDLVEFLKTVLNVDHGVIDLFAVLVLGNEVGKV